MDFTYYNCLPTKNCFQNGLSTQTQNSYTDEMLCIIGLSVAFLNKTPKHKTTDKNRQVGLLETWKQSTPSVGDWLHKLWSIQTMQGVKSVIKKCTIKSQRTWKNLKCIITE